MTPDLVPPEVWADEGRRTAPSFTDVAAAVIVGRDPEAVAAVALGIASACAGERRVAVADLIGGVPALTPLSDQPGLLECLRDGIAVSDIGQPYAGSADVYILPSGNGPIAERWVFESGRWERLVNGFREVDALLLLVARVGTPGLESLIARVDGVVAVDLPPAEIRAWPLIATIDHPEPELPPIPGTPPPGLARVLPVAKPRRKVGRWIALGLAIAVATGIGFGEPIATRLAALGGSAGADSLAIAGAADSAAAAGLDSAATSASQPLPSDFTFGPIVNPADSANALRFSVELVAANSLAGANSSLTPRGEPYPVPTVAPVVLGAAPSVWYRALVGAWATQREAEDWLSRQRALGLLRSSVGRVTQVPYAVQLFEGPREEALRESLRLGGEDLRVYTLESNDGRVRVFAGAFESANQALWFAAQLHERGLSPQLAYRTGR